MTKYARNKDGFLTDVWRVPEDYPTIEIRDRCLGAANWIVVPDSAIHGAKDNGDGTYTNPVAPVLMRPIVYTWDGFNKYLIGRLNLNGRAKLQAVLESARDFVGTDNAAKNTRGFYTWFVGTTEFEKEETAEMLQYLVDAAIILARQRDAVLNNWATKPGL